MLLTLLATPVLFGGGGTNPGTAVYPDPSEVAEGVEYGPNGDDYVGTRTGGGTVGFLLLRMTP